MSYRIFGQELERHIEPPALAPIVEVEPREPVYFTKVALIQAMTAAHFDLPVSEMKSPCRARKSARPRQVAIWLCRELLKEGWSSLGRRFNRDHTTAIYACRKVKAFIAEDPIFAVKVDILQVAVQKALGEHVAPQISVANPLDGKSETALGSNTF